MPAVLQRQDSGSGDASAPSLNPSLIVGICVLGAIFFCVILASVIRLCQRMPARPSYNAENPPEDLFRPYSQEQVERMREVRWLNHSEMWEAGKQARMETGEQFGPRPKFNRRTGVGWGFVVGKDGYMRKADHGVGEAEDAWSSHGTSGEVRQQSTVNDTKDTNVDEYLQHNQLQPYLRPSSSYYEDCDPAVRYSLQHPRKPVANHLGTTYEELDRPNDETPEYVATEPFPDLPQTSGIEQRFRGQERVRHVRMVRNDNLMGTEPGQSVNTLSGTVVRKPVITLNEESYNMMRSKEYEQADTYGTGHATAMRDLTGAPHAR